MKCTSNNNIKITKKIRTKLICRDKKYLLHNPPICYISTKYHSYWAGEPSQGYSMGHSALTLSLKRMYMCFASMKKRKKHHWMQLLCRTLRAFYENSQCCNQYNA